MNNLRDFQINLLVFLTPTIIFLSGNFYNSNSPNRTHLCTVITCWFQKNKTNAKYQKKKNMRISPLGTHTILFVYFMTRNGIFMASEMCQKNSKIRQYAKMGNMDNKILDFWNTTTIRQNQNGTTYTFLHNCHLLEYNCEIKSTGVSIFFS